MRALATTAAVLTGSIILCSCGGPGRTQSGKEPSLSPSSSQPVPTRHPTVTPASSSPGSATDSLLLARQVRIQQGGDGIGPTCHVEGDTPQSFRQDPGAWVNSLTSYGEYPGLTVLCLRGFSTSGAIDVEVVAGHFRAHTSVLPTVGSPESDTPLGYEEEPGATLFDDRVELRVYTKDYGSYPIDGPPGSMVSEMWQFLPPEAAREKIASVGSFTLTATQAGRSVTVRQTVERPSTRASYTLSSPAPSGRLVLLEYPGGADVPIGLFREEGPETGRAQLVRQVGTVRVPTSRVATYTIPANLKSGLRPGWYCVLPPMSAPADCHKLHSWPDYPGQIRPGDRGESVRAWQRILIEAGVVSDRPENRDGYYGPATQGAVHSYLRNLGAATGPQDRALGSHAYALLTGIVVRP